MVTDVEVLVLALEYVEKTVVVGVLTLFEVDVDTLVLTEVDVLELNDVDCDVDVDVLELKRKIQMKLYCTILITNEILTVGYYLKLSRLICKPYGKYSL